MNKILHFLVLLLFSVACDVSHATNDYFRNMHDIEIIEYDDVQIACALIKSLWQTLEHQPSNEMLCTLLDETRAFISLDVVTQAAYETLNVLEEKAQTSLYKPIIEYLHRFIQSSKQMDILADTTLRHKLHNFKGPIKPTILKNLLVQNNATVKGNFISGASYAPSKQFSHNAHSGFVGIGTDSPQTQLDIRGNTHVQNNLTVGNSMTISTMESGVVCSVDGTLDVQQIQKGNLADNSVGAFELLDRCIINDKIAAGAITLDKLQQPLEGDVAIDGNLVFAKSLNAIGSETESSLRIVRGALAADGTITTGDGFLVEVSSTGVYQITFFTEFSDTTSYLIVATPQGSSSCMISSSNASASQATISTFSNEAAPTNQAFTFIAIGI